MASSYVSLATKRHATSLDMTALFRGTQNRFYTSSDGLRPRALSARARRARSQDRLEPRQDVPGEDPLPFRIRVDTVFQVQLLLSCHALEKERDERQALLLREAREETAEPLLVLRSVAGRNQHSAEEDARSGLARFRDDPPEVPLGLVERESPEAVVGAQGENDDVRLLREDPLRPPEPAGRRVARDPRVHHADRPAPLRELLRHDGRKRLVDRKAEPRRQAVAQEDDEGRVGGNRPHGSRVPACRSGRGARG